MNSQPFFIGEMEITMYLIFIQFPLNIASNYFFLVYLNLSFIGAAIHICFMSFLLLLLYILYLTLFTQIIQIYWPGLTKEAFHSWAEFLKLGKRPNCHNLSQSDVNHS